MKISLTVDSKQLEAYLERTVVNVRRTATKWVRAEAESILQDSLQQVPVDTGTLADSAYIEEQPDGSYVIGYGHGGMNPKSNALPEDYMIKQHEDLSLNHPGGGKAKFLEDPAREHGVNMELKAARAIKEVL